MKYLLAALALCSMSAMAANSPTKITGWISDSQCGAMHSSKNPDPACVKKCIGGGAKPVFVDDAKNQVWMIDDPDSVKDHYGHHVSVMASADPTAKSIHIDKVTMLPDQGKKGTGSEMNH